MKYAVLEIFQQSHSIYQHFRHFFDVLPLRHFDFRCFDTLPFFNVRGLVDVTSFFSLHTLITGNVRVKHDEKKIVVYRLFRPSAYPLAYFFSE